MKQRTVSLPRDFLAAAHIKETALVIYLGHPDRDLSCVNL